MQIPSSLTDCFLHGRDERSEVVALFGLELGDALRVDARAAKLRESVLGDAAELRPGLACQELDIQPPPQPRLVGEDRRDLWGSVAWDHLEAFYRGPWRHPGNT